MISHFVPLLALLALGYAVMAPTPAAAMTHVVGGSYGWRVPPNHRFFQEWAKPRTFGAGDRLIFPYRISLHNVLQVSKKDYDHCTQEEMIAQYPDGPTLVSLNKTGDYYYYSGIGLQCEAGQKLHITVVDGVGSSGMPGTPIPRTTVHLESGNNLAAAPSTEHQTSAASSGNINGVVVEAAVGLLATFLLSQLL